MNKVESREFVMEMGKIRRFLVRRTGGRCLW